MLNAHLPSILVLGYIHGRQRVVRRVNDLIFARALAQQDIVSNLSFLVHLHWHDCFGVPFGVFQTHPKGILRKRQLREGTTITEVLQASRVDQLALQNVLFDQLLSLTNLWFPR
jgi:hypothetical protein